METSEAFNFSTGLERSDLQVRRAGEVPRAKPGNVPLLHLESIRRCNPCRCLEVRLFGGKFFG